MIYLTKLDFKFISKIYVIITNVCKKINIVLDTSKYKGQVIGLPYNIPFTKRCISNDTKEVSLDSPETTIHIPANFRKIKSMPEDPANSVAYGMQTRLSRCFLMIYPIDNKSAMPYGNVDAVIDGIHRTLSDTQGLVEVNAGTTKHGKKYVYSIVKSKLKPCGTQYILTINIDMNKNTTNIQAFFDEVGMTGFRDSTILNKMIGEGTITLPNMDDWFQDPYDKNYKKGLRMNLSEQSEYDAFFPQHPLSEARSFIEYVINNN